MLSTYLSSPILVSPTPKYCQISVFNFFTKWVKMTKKGIFLWYIHAGEVWDPITDQTRVDVPLYPKMIFKY